MRDYSVCVRGLVVGWATALAVLLTVSGCESTSASSDVVGAPEVPIDLGQALDAAPPPGLSAADVSPLVGDARARAELTEAQVRAALIVPDFLKGAEPVDDAEPDRVSAPEPPLATQRLYAAARQKIREGKTAEAVQLLESALRLAPNDAPLLRLLGRGWATLGNRVRATEYLRQALEADGGDLESMILLGRFLLEAGDLESGLATLFTALDRADELADLDPALPALNRFYLAASLTKAGYLRAALGQYEGYLAAPRDNLRPTRYGTELRFLDRRLTGHRAVIGDLYHRLDEPEKARASYALAEQSGGSGDLNLVKRIVYSDLRLGRLGEARERLVAYARDAQGAPASLALVEYAIAQGLPAEPIVRELRTLYLDAKQPAALALALAAALPHDAGVSLLSEHLDTNPDDRAVHDRLLAMLLGAEADADSRAEAIRRAAAAIERDPQSASRTAGALLALSPDLPALRDAFTTLSSETRGQPIVQTLEALVVSEVGEQDTAAALLDKAIAGDDTLDLAKIEKARLLALEGDYDAAQALIGTVDAGLDNPRLGQLRVGILLNLGRDGEALRLMDELIEHDPAQLHLIVQKARLLTRLDRVPEAEQTLLDALAREPKQEAYYAELIRLYDNASGDYSNNYRRILRRLLQTLPASRTARFEVASNHEARRQFAQAQPILEGLVTQNSADRQARLLLAEVYEKSGQREKAVEQIDVLLEQAPEDPAVLQQASKFFEVIGDQERFLETVTAFLQTQPAGFERNARLAQAMIRVERYADAVATMREVIDTVEAPQSFQARRVMAIAARRLPIDEAEPVYRELMDRAEDPEERVGTAYTLVLMLDQAGRLEAAERVLVEVLDENPNDPVLNNALGYRWAVDGRKLEEAATLIGKSLAVEPNNAAYLDSMGWVRYKQGRFAEAVDWLQKSVVGEPYPVIYDHLGDALYRQGKVDEAVEAWERAKQLVDAGLFSVEEDPEMEGLGGRIEAKLAAVADGDAVPVSAVPEPAMAAE